MLNNFINVSVAKAVADYSGKYEMFSSDAWAFAGQVTAIGMGMIFAVLALLWGILSIFNLVFGAKKAPKAAKVEAPKAAKVEAPAPVAEPTPAESSDDALIAVIAAAVAAYRADENGGVEPDGSFRVVSFRRIGGGRSWNAK